VVLFCRSTEVSREWYAKLGFEYLRGFDGMHWFRLGEGELMLHPTDGEPQPQGTILHAAVSDVDTYFRMSCRWDTPRSTISVTGQRRCPSLSPGPGGTGSLN